LDMFDEIRVCTAYRTPDGTITEFPLDLDIFSQCEPIYDTLPGWKSDISQLTSFDELPENARKYVDYINKKTGVNIKMVSVGTRRRQTIHLLTI